MARRGAAIQGGWHDKSQSRAGAVPRGLTREQSRPLGRQARRLPRHAVPDPAQHRMTVQRDTSEALAIHALGILGRLGRFGFIVNGENIPILDRQDCRPSPRRLM